MATIALDRPRTLPVELPVKATRLDRVDLLRGVVMVLMVLDHVRAYFTEIRFDPTDITQTRYRSSSPDGSPTSARQRSYSSPARAHGSPAPGGRAENWPTCS